MKSLRIGTRGSSLALWQAQWVAKQLLICHPTLDIHIVTIKTTGDIRLEAPIPELGGKGLFTTEIEEALLKGEIDLAVHSLKDLPCEMPRGLAVAAYTQREDARDVLIGKSGLTLEELPPGSLLGTSSLRRKALILSINPGLNCVDLRGNIDTRLRKLDESRKLQGIVVAAAGIHRMGWQDRITHYLDDAHFLPAAGQGVIALEMCAQHSELGDFVACINHLPSELEARAERSFLSTLQAGCHEPVGARASYQQGPPGPPDPPGTLDIPKQASSSPLSSPGTLVLKGMIARIDGSKILRTKATGTNPEVVGAEAAKTVLTKIGSLS
ncbi:MAG: hydroxymethylbilane synthase [Coriobacteriia bacterium]|nr:hydroxymethylbilane synthase [Coriobacteriia bacterium]